MVIKFYSYAADLFMTKTHDKLANEWIDERYLESLTHLDEDLEKNVNGKLLAMTSSVVGEHYVVTIAHDDEEKR